MTVGKCGSTHYSRDFPAPTTNNNKENLYYDGLPKGCAR